MTSPLDQAAAWCSARLRTLLSERSGDDMSLAALRPLVGAWFGNRAPGITDDDDWLAIEVAHQRGDDSDAFPMDPPPGLDDDAEWFSVGILRTLNARREDNISDQQTVGLDLWWPATPGLQTLCADPQWDTGNLLGFDCVGHAGPAAERLLTSPIVRKIFATFGDTPPMAALLVASADDDQRLI